MDLCIICAVTDIWPEADHYTGLPLVGCPINHYRHITTFSVQIYYTGTKEADSRFSDVGDVFTLGAGRMMNLTGLTPDTVYTITVAAINGAGEGDRSTAITQRTDMARECANCLKSDRAVATQLNHKPSLVPRLHFSAFLQV